MLEAINITKWYDQCIIDKINLTIKPGQLIGLIGKSGSGKTTLLKILAGLIPPDSGHLHFLGKPMFQTAQQLIPGHPDVRLVNQDFSLDRFHTTEENIREEILYLPTKERDELIQELITLLDLHHVATQQAFTLSGGEQQRLSIARALAKEPQIILLDEPFSNLDATLRLRITDYLLKLRSIRQCAIVLVSHDPQDVLAFSDVIFHLQNKTLVKLGAPQKAYYKFKNLKQARLLGPINSVQKNGKRIHFRPDEYTHANDESLHIKVNFSSKYFTGKGFEYVFKTTNNETLILYSLTPIDDIKSIEIQKRTND